MLKAALLDIDGTFLDSNDAHARAWVVALERNGHAVSADQVRPLIGKGGDKLLHELLDIDDESAEGKRISEARRQVFTEDFLPTLKPTRGARDLLERLGAQGLQLVVATSASGEELDGLLRQAGIAGLIEKSATSSDAAQSKPDPDIVQAALQRAGVGAAEAVLIGDTPHDIEAGANAGVPTVALRCGGHWTDAQLQGAAFVCDDPADLLARLDQSPLGDPGTKRLTKSAPDSRPQGAQATDPLGKDSSGPGGSTYGGLRDAASTPSDGPSGAVAAPYTDDAADDPAPENHVEQRDAQRTLPDR